MATGGDDVDTAAGDDAVFKTMAIEKQVLFDLKTSDQESQISRQISQNLDTHIKKTICAARYL